MNDRQHILAIANQKGGVGKTTTTATLGGLLSAQGYRCLMIDLDPHGSLSAYFGIDPETVEHSVYDLFQQLAQGQPPDAGVAIQASAFERLDVLPASTALATLEKQFGGRNGMGLVVRRALQAIEPPYDYVLIDCPPMLGMLMINALAACGQLVIPVQTEYLAIKGLQRMLRTLKMIEQSLRASLRFHILPTLYDQRTRASRECLQQLQAAHGEHLTDTVIPVDTKFRDASHAGKPASLMFPATHGVKAYGRFLHEAALGRIEEGNSMQAVAS